MASHPATIQDIEAYLGNIDPNAFQYWCSQDDAPTLADVKAFEAEVGFDLPDDFRAFSTSRLGGLHIEVPEAIWPRRQGGAFWWFLYGVSVFGIGKEIPDWLDLRSQHAKFQADGIRELLPFMRVQSDPDRYCFTRDGHIVRWAHDSGASDKLRESFPTLLMRELHALEERKNRVVSEGLIG